MVDIERFGDETLAVALVFQLIEMRRHHDNGGYRHPSGATCTWNARKLFGNKERLCAVHRGASKGRVPLRYAGVLMEVPIAMVLLSKILSKKANCLSNIFAGSIKTIVMCATLFMGAVTKYYLFFAVIEIATTSFVVVYAWKWLKQKDTLA